MSPNYSLENQPVECPKCGRTSHAIKCYSLPNYILFIGIFLAWSFKKEICCPECMRKQILIKYFTYNIIIGNIVWLFLGLPMGIWKLISSYTDGHSATVQDILAEQEYENSRRQAQYNNTGNQYNI